MSDVLYEARHINPQKNLDEAVVPTVRTKEVGRDPYATAFQIAPFGKGT